MWPTIRVEPLGMSKYCDLRRRSLHSTCRTIPARSHIRLSLIDTAHTDVAVGACGSGGDCVAIHLRPHDARKTRQQYCDDTSGPTRHAASKSSCSLARQPSATARFQTRCPMASWIAMPLEGSVVARGSHRRVGCPDQRSEKRGGDDQRKDEKQQFPFAALAVADQQVTGNRHQRHHGPRATGIRFHQAA
jgi:hypothetical protein